MPDVRHGHLVNGQVNRAVRVHAASDVLLNWENGNRPPDDLVLRVDFPDGQNETEGKRWQTGEARAKLLRLACEK